MMAKLIARFGPRLPGLLARAAVGDPVAIATLVGVGGLAVYALIGKK